MSFSFNLSSRFGPIYKCFAHFYELLITDTKLLIFISSFTTLINFQVPLDESIRSSLSLKDQSLLSFSPKLSEGFTSDSKPGEMSAPVCETDAKSRSSSAGAPTHSSSLPISPQKSGDVFHSGFRGSSSPDTKTSDCEALPTAVFEADAPSKSTPRSLRARGRSLASYTPQSQLFSPRKSGECMETSTSGSSASHTDPGTSGSSSGTELSKSSRVDTAVDEAGAGNTPRSLRARRRGRSLAQSSGEGDFLTSSTGSTPHHKPVYCEPIATPVCEPHATSTPRSLRARNRSLALSATSTLPFSPHRSGEFSNSGTSGSSTPDLKLSNCETVACPDPVFVTDATSTPPRSLKSRGRSLAPSSAFKEPGQPVSVTKSARRKTQHCKPSKSPEQM